VKFSELSEIEHDAIYSNDFVISKLCIDSRAIQKGDTYLAIKGDRFDGHSFVDAAISSGASSLVVSEAVEAGVPSIRVSDTTISLGNIAKIYRSKLPAKVIGITGSNGKTTVKEMVSSICRECGAVTATIYNNNNTIGVPLTLLSASMQDDFVVVEMGTSEQGEIAYLSGIAEPDVSVITNVSESHLLGIGSRQDVFTEKSAIISATKRDGTVVINHDDAFSNEAKQMVRSDSTLTYGFSSDADINGKFENTSDGVKVSVRSPAGEFKYRLSLRGKHNVANSFAAIALCSAVGVDVAAMIKGLENYSGTNGRLQTMQLGHEVYLIDDTYNANPASSIAALEVLSDYPGRKLFVFAGMAELGSQEVALHESVGQKANETDVDALFVFGKMAEPAADKYEGEKYRFDSIDDLTAKLKSYIKPGDVVLVKGSRRFQMDRVSRYLEKELG
jgi:UDP-N-acetylmuramoyl-tripeptide--D-alanyl-D-alanine ligase